MSMEFRLPALQGSPEATIDRWLKKAGDAIAKCEILVETHSDQFDWNIPAPSHGTVAEIRADIGATVREGDVLATLVGAANWQSADAQAVSGGAAPSARCDTGKVPVPHNGASAARPEAGPRVTPLAAAMAADRQVDLTNVTGTGVGGQVTKEDVLAAIRQREAVPSNQTDALPQAAADVQAAPSLVPKAMRAVPQSSFFISVDLANVSHQRDALQSAWQRREGCALDTLPFLVSATASALRGYPELNSVFTQAGIKTQPSIDLTLVPAAQGNPVSIIHGAEVLSLVGVSRRLQQAQNGTTSDGTQGTFAICDRRSGGAVLSTGILPNGHSALLTISTIQPCVVADGDGLAIHSMVYLGLTYDQRLIDDYTAGRFMRLLQQQLETGTFH